MILLPNLKILKLSHIGLNSIDIIIDSDRDYSGLCEMDLSWNRINSIEASYFKSLYNLVRLDLSNNNISTIETNLFSNMTKLIFLNLEGNQIAIFPKDTLYASTSLEIFSFGKNKLITLSRLAKNWFGALKSVDYSFNLLKSFDCTASFYEYSILEKIFLSNNLISEVTNNDFKYLGSLVELYLNFNKISFIGNGSLSYLVKLERLCLQNNNLVELESNTFYGLFRLRFLNLSSNRIEIIDKNLFKDLLSINTLDLSSNNLYTIQDNSTLKLVQLETLYLQNNLNLKIIEKSLTGLQNIENVFISIEIFNYSLNKINFIKSFKPRLHKLVNKRIYYKSIYVTAINANQSIYQNKSECYLVLYFIINNIHLNLKTDFEIREYLNVCKKTELVYFSKNDNKYYLIVL